MSLSRKGFKSYSQIRLLNKSERMGMTIAKIIWIWEEYD